MEKQFTPERIQELKELQFSVDEAGKGQLEKYEIQVAIDSENYELEEGQFDFIFDALDYKNLTYIEWQDQLGLFYIIQFPFSETKEVKAVFDSFDQDKSGSISKNVLGEAVQQLGVETTQEQIDQVYSQIDVNQSGSVDFKEFFIFYKGVKAE